jgi:hypothetical protein
MNYKQFDKTGHWGLWKKSGKIILGVTGMSNAWKKKSLFQYLVKFNDLKTEAHINNI